jgi:NAD(P)H-quinone oxidoreductase subunit 4
MLSTLILLPIIGAIAVGFIPTKNTRLLALIISSIILTFTVVLASKFDFTTSALQFTEYLRWIPQLGLNYKLGLDGLSMPLIGLSGLLTWIAIYGSNPNIERPRIYYALIFLVNASLAGAFLAQNLLFFVIAYEIELIPMYLLINIWGGEKRSYAATKFLIYTAISGIIILAGFFGITWLSGATSFDVDVFNNNPIQTSGLPVQTQLILLIVLLIGFGIKIPIVPLHTWLPTAYTEASPPVAILLGGILAKLGTYGLIRFALGLFPETWQLIAPGLATIGTISVLYGALTAIAQKDIKRMVAYSSIGHMGYILLGAASATSLSLVGTISQMVAHGLILALLFHLVGIIEAKVGTRELDILNGLMNPIRGLPLITAFLVLAGMASAGIPGLVGFVAEFVVFQGSYTTFPVLTLICVLGTGLTAVYFVILLNRTCFGRLDSQKAYYPQVTLQEKLPAFILASLIFILGIQPNWLLHWSETTSKTISTIVAEQYPAISQQIIENNLPPT